MASSASIVASRLSAVTTAISSFIAISASRVLLTHTIAVISLGSAPATNGNPIQALAWLCVVDCPAKTRRTDTEPLALVYDAALAEITMRRITPPNPTDVE